MAITEGTALIIAGAVIAGVAFTCYVGYEIAIKKINLRRTFRVLGDKQEDFAGVLEDMVRSGELCPAT